VKEAEANAQHKSIIGVLRAAAPKLEFQQINFVVGNRRSVVKTDFYTKLNVSEHMPLHRVCWFYVTFNIYFYANTARDVVTGLLSEDCFYYCSERNNAAFLFGTLKVQSFILTEVSDYGLLIVVTSSTFLKREDKRQKSGSLRPHPAS